MQPEPRCDILAVSSPGGHWTELMRLRPAFDGRRTEFATCDSSRAADVQGSVVHLLVDANQRTPARLVICGWQVLRLLLKRRPRVVVSTGAAPGLIALALGRLVGARTVWVDSIAAVERMTLSGRLARNCADLYLVQWPHLARPNGPHYRGSLL